MGSAAGAAPVEDKRGLVVDMMDNIYKDEVRISTQDQNSKQQQQHQQIIIYNTLYIFVFIKEQHLEKFSGNIQHCLDEL